MNKNNIIERFKDYDKIVLDCNNYTKARYRNIVTQDKLGYKYLESLQDIKNTNNLRKFSKFNPYTIENLKLFIKLNKIQVKILSEKVVKNKEKYLFICLKCNSTFETSLNGFVNSNNRCPYCCKNPQKVNNTNSLRSKAPHLVKYLKYDLDADRYTPSSNKVISMICPECGTEKNQSLNKLDKQGFSCRACSDGVSTPNKFMFNLLKIANVEFKSEKSFIWSKNKRYDFYIEKSNTIIEMNGKQHYTDFNFEKSLKEVQDNDKLKEKIAKENEILNYIIVDCSKIDFNFIVKNIKIKELEHLSFEDYLKAWELSQNSLIPKVWNLWNSGKTTLDISKETKLSRFTIIEYLKNGNMLNKCKYDSKIEWSKNSSTNGKKNSKIIQMYLKNGKFIKEWENAKQCGNFFNLKNGNYINSICRTGKVYKDKYILKYKLEEV